MSRADHFTHTEADAAEFERRYGPEYDDDRISLSDLAEEGRADRFAGVVRLGTTPGEQYGWECGRCDAVSGLQWGEEDRARAAFDVHECSDAACPECPTGMVVSVGRMERETGHQPYACDAGCGFSG